MSIFGSVMISQLSCPVCRRKIVIEKTNSMPFCSERCRLVDLGRWINEEIGVPVEPGSLQEAEQEADQGADTSS